MSRKYPISLEALETLDAIERRGSFAKAAEELNRATSAISYMVQKLEEQLDISLFQRQGRRSRLTPAGEVVLTEGRDILNASARLADRAREVATGWEPRLRIAVESVQPPEVVFALLERFLRAHPGIEIDVCESVLNGGWEALEQDRVDLLVGAPGPVPRQQGYRAILLNSGQLVPVIAASHPLARLAGQREALLEQLPGLRRIVTHDTSQQQVSRSAGLSDSGKRLYVQNMDQKVAAILAGIGIGHLPRQRIQQYLDSGRLKQLAIAEQHPNYASNEDNYLAWKISHKGKGLQALASMFSEADWQAAGPA